MNARQRRTYRRLYEAAFGNHVGYWITVPIGGNVNKQTHQPSTDIMAQHTNSTPDELRRALAAWVDTAAQHLRNEEYWRERALKAEGKTDAEIADWGH